MKDYLVANFPQKMNLETDLLLLLTATIDVKGMPKAYPTLPEQRQEDYFNSLKYYINHYPKIRKIIFIENSGWPLDRIQEATSENPYNKEIELISLNCNEFPRKFGKGYGESLLIDKGLAQSRLINEVTHIAKITGRIYLLNLEQILEGVTQPYDCLCDFKTIGWRIKKFLTDEQVSPYVDTRFLVFSKGFYSQYIQPLHQQHQEGCFYLELEYYQAIKMAQDRAKVIFRFPKEPKFSGIAGHFQGKNYSSPKEQTKFFIRALTRQAAPWLYL